MKINPQKAFKYLDYSNNIFTKIQLVNTLSSKEIEKLNEKYKELGLFIKQVSVDNYGNIKNQEFLNKKRLIKKSRMNLQEFFNKYYLNDKKPKKSNKKIKQNGEKKNSNDSNEDELNNNNDYYLNEEEISEKKNYLKERFNDCQNVHYKKCRIDDENFKKKIIEYIIKFKNYISNTQYLELFDKWKNENMKIKGVNLFNDDQLEDFRLPILKAFKSEITLLAFINRLGKENIDDNDNDNDKSEKKDEKKEEEKDNNESKNDSDSDNNEDNEDIDNYNYLAVQLKKIGNMDEE